VNECVINIYMRDVMSHRVTRVTSEYRSWKKRAIGPTHPHKDMCLDEVGQEKKRRKEGKRKRKRKRKKGVE